MWQLTPDYLKKMSWKVHTHTHIQYVGLYICIYNITRAAAGQMGALSRIVLLCPPPSNIMEVKKKKPTIGVKIEL